MANEYVAEDFWLPIYPLVIIHGGLRNHLLKRIVASLLTDPLYTLGGKY